MSRLSSFFIYVKQKCRSFKSLLRVQKPEEVDESIWVKVQNLYLYRSFFAHTLGYILIASMGVKDEDVQVEIFK